MKPRYKWMPLVRSEEFKPIRIEIVQWCMKSYNLDEAAARKFLEDDAAKCETWINDLYQVQKRYLDNGMIHLNIRRRDGAAVLRDWRHFQYIKNQLIGLLIGAVMAAGKAEDQRRYHHCHHGPTGPFDNHDL